MGAAKAAAKAKVTARVAKEASLLRTARTVLDERLDYAGFAENYEVTGGIGPQDGSVTFKVEITITDLDIEQARREGK